MEPDFARPIGFIAIGITLACIAFYATGCVPQDQLKTAPRAARHASWSSP
jgi:hypothetical protein